MVAKLEIVDLPMGNYLWVRPPPDRGYLLPMSLICVPIKVHDLPQALAAAQRAHELAADLVEFRIDECFSGCGEASEEQLVLKLVSQSPIPCIVTCRSGDEGGVYDGDDMERVSLYERLGTASGIGEFPPRYIDCEFATYTRSENIKQKINLAVQHPRQLRDLSTSLILSMHDFYTRPDDLTRRLLAAQDEPAAKIVKVVYRARSLRDALELLDLPKDFPKPLISLGMGEFGVITRILTAKFGGFLTFASLDPSGATAPGQPTLKQLLETYRFRKINSDTRVYGVVGWPIGHTLSPLVHNAGFDALDINSVYVPLPIASSDDRDASYISFKATMLELLQHPRLDFSGCSVTLPHKENLVKLAIEQGWTIDPLALIVGAANTLIVHHDRSITVSNTDIAAAVGAIQRHCSDLRGKNAGVIGAGGVGRAIAFGLAQAGSNVIVFNRTKATAEKLVNELAAQYQHSQFSAAADLSEMPNCCCDVFVNCTPLGMKGSPDEHASPIPVDRMNKCKHTPIVLDTVYNPLETPLLKQAREHGWTTIEGANMFVAQAEAQFHAFTDRRAPQGLFDRLTRQELAHKPASEYC